MPKNATAAQRLSWHLQHEKHCDCRQLTAAQRAKLEESATKVKPARKKATAKTPVR